MAVTGPLDLQIQDLTGPQSSQTPTPVQKGGRLSRSRLPPSVRSQAAAGTSVIITVPPPLPPPPPEDCSRPFPRACHPWSTAIVQGVGRGLGFREEGSRRVLAGVSWHAGLWDPRLQACSLSQAAATPSHCPGKSLDRHLMNRIKAPMGAPSCRPLGNEPEHRALCPTHT